MILQDRQAVVGEFNPSLRIAVQPVPGQSLTLYYKDFPPGIMTVVQWLCLRKFEFYLDQETSPFRQCLKIMAWTREKSQY